jgi:hypothetical protein
LAPDEEETVIPHVSLLHQPPPFTTSIRLTLVSYHPPQHDASGTYARFIPDDPPAEFFEDRSARRDARASSDEDHDVMSRKVAVVGGETAVRSVEEERSRR